MRAWVMALVLVGGCSADEEEACSDWFCADTATPTEAGSAGGGSATKPGTGGTDGKGGTGGKTGSTGSKTGTTGGGYGIQLSFEVDVGTGLGMMWLDQAGCTSSFTINEATERTDCELCTFAWDVVTDIAGGDETPCPNMEVWSGLVQSYGHGAPDRLYYDKDSGWIEITQSGSSAVEGEVWTFGVMY